jgi:hypothetical protein
MRGGGTRRQFHRLNPDVGEHLQELCRERRIAIIDQIPLPNKQTIDGIAVVPADLAHPQSVGLSSNPSDLHASAGRTAPRSCSPRRVRTSTVKKSAATSSSQWRLKNSFQLV